MPIILDSTLSTMRHTSLDHIPVLERVCLMFWIVQENMHREDGFVSLVEGLQRLDIPHQIVKVVPFSDELPDDEQTIPPLAPEGPVMVCGSTTLAKIAARRGWSPGSFLNDQHDYRAWLSHYGDNLLNAEARVCRFGDVEPIWSPFFIRPCEDSKTFAGQVTDWDDFQEWQHKVIALRETYTSLDANTMVTYSPVRQIFNEVRFFVVDGKIVGKSLYKLGSRVTYSDIVDDDAVAFAQSMIDRWQPARAFVIDTALTDEGHKVVEINCINSAGFYAIDVMSFIIAIEEMDGL